MPNEILKLLREIHQVISRHLQATNDPISDVVTEVTREDWSELRDKIVDAIEEEDWV
jgi:hypothetical protein